MEFKDKNNKEEHLDKKVKNEVCNEVAPPAHIWDRISEKLNSNQDGIKKMNPRDEEDVKAS